MEKIKKIMFTLICFLSFSLMTYADSVKVSANKSSTIVGNSITITAKVSTSSPMVSVEGSLRCSGAGTSGGISLNYDDSSNSLNSKSYSYTVKPTTSGTVICTATGVRTTNMSSSGWNSVGDSSVKIKVITQAELEATYSKNNNLKSLSIEGQTLTPEFNKDTLEYSVELENDVETIKISAEVEDKTASVTGLGDIALQEGTNKLEVKVMAQNGNEKVYIINANVKELDPVMVKIDKKEYTVVRKAKALEKPHESFEESTTTINNTEVFAYYNKMSKLTVVGLKDKDGKIGYYSYSDKTKKFTNYNQIAIGGLVLDVIDINKSDIPDGYKEYSLKIGDVTLKGYKLKNSSKYYLISGINLTTGKKNLYMYEKSEQTIQLYNEEEIAIYKDLNNKYLLGIIIGGSSVGLLIIIITIISILKNKNKDKNNKKNKVKNILKNSDI